MITQLQHCLFRFLSSLFEFLFLFTRFSCFLFRSERERKIDLRCKFLNLPVSFPASSLASRSCLLLRVRLGSASRSRLRVCRLTGVLTIYMETRKFQLENQMVRIIPFGVLLKLWASGQSDALLLLLLGFTADVHTFCMLSIFF